MVAWGMNLIYYISPRHFRALRSDSTLSDNITACSCKSIWDLPHLSISHVELNRLIFVFVSCLSVLRSNPIWLFVCARHSKSGSLMTNHFDNLNIAGFFSFFVHSSWPLPFQHRTSPAAMNREIPGFYYGKSCFDAFLPFCRSALWQYVRGVCSCVPVTHIGCIVLSSLLAIVLSMQWSTTPLHTLTPVSTHRPGEEEVLQDSSQPCGSSKCTIHTGPSYWPSAHTVFASRIAVSIILNH